MNNNTDLNNQNYKRGSESGKIIMVLAGILAGVLLTCLIVPAVFTISGYHLTRTSSEDLVENIAEPAETDAVSAETISKLNFIRSLLDEDFLFGTDAADFETGLIKGYVDSLEDPYTVYYTADEYISLMETTTGSYSGIGVVVTQDEATGNILVSKPYENEPGAEAGMLPGDVIYKIEGEEVTGMDLNLAVTRIKGEEGTSVNITVYRPSENIYLDMNITRKTVEMQTISYEMLDGQIGYIEMSGFDEVTYNQFMNAYNDLKSQGMKAVIVDIRNNGGGLLNCAVNILDQLLPEGIITYTEDKNGERQDYMSDADSVLDIPMAVLVNGYSASASEIFTGALQDYGVATIVGTQTFGKGIVQYILPLSDGTALKLTVSRYFTPNGICIHGEGITPDVVVELNEDVSTLIDIPEDEDNQLQEAIKVLEEKMKD